MTTVLVEDLEVRDDDGDIQGDEVERQDDGVKQQR
jgi:hypothetical protein